MIEDTEREALVVGLFDSGYSIRYICDRSGLRSRSVRTVLARYQRIAPLPARPRQGDAVDGKRAETVRLHRDEGWATARIAPWAGVSERTIYRWWKRVGYDPLGATVEAREAKRAEIGELFKSGARPPEIAAEMGLPRSTVYDALSTLGCLGDNGRMEYPSAKEVADGLVPGKMLCSGCGIICDTDATGLCDHCDPKRKPERVRDIDTSDDWLRRNTVIVKRGE